MTLLVLVQQTMGYSVQLTKPVLTVTEGEISRIMLRGVFCVHKPYFLMPGHISRNSPSQMHYLHNYMMTLT